MQAATAGICWPFQTVPAETVGYCGLQTSLLSTPGPVGRRRNGGVEVGEFLKTKTEQEKKSDLRLSVMGNGFSLALSFTRASPLSLSLFLSHTHTLTHIYKTTIHMWLSRAPSASAGLANPISWVTNILFATIRVHLRAL